MKFTIACVLLTLVYEATSTSTTLSLRGKNRDLQENCGSFGTCNVRSTCTATGCVCKDGFVEPPDCRDLDECTELDDPPCQFEGVVCVDMDPNLDGSPGGKYKCACRTKDGYEDGPVSNEFGPTSCVFVGSGMTDDPCASAPCHPDATCAPSGATFTCTCTGDLVGDGTTDCSPPDDGAPCASANDCADNPNSFCSEELKKCVCEEGFFQGAGAGGQCKPENFCTLGQHDCDANADCQPLLGDAANGFFTCKCNSGYTDSTEPNIQVGRKCVPHDECSDGSHGCDDATEACVNLEPPLTNVCINKTLAPVTMAPVEQIAVTPAPAPLPFCERTNCIVPQSFCAAESSACSCVAGTSGDPLSLCLDENLITPDTIFGSGNSNGGFTIGRGGGVELGLRAKVRYDYKNRPTERSLEFAFDGKRTYKFYKGTPANTAIGGTSGTPAPPVTPDNRFARWNIDWSINSDYDTLNPSGKKLDDLTYALSLDIDPSGQQIVPSDPINVGAPTLTLLVPGHSFGDNETPNSGGEETSSSARYQELIAESNVAQSSFNYGFTFLLPSPFNAPFLSLPFNNQAVGTYTIGLKALDGGTVVAETSIDVEICDDNVTPPNIIYGTGGNVNGGFTTTRKDGVELGLRGIWRGGIPNTAPFNTNDPNGFNSDGTYNFPAIASSASSTRARWSFDWTINTDYEETTGSHLDEYTYLLTTVAGGNTLREFDPIHDTPFGQGVGAFPDHSIGDNNTGDNAGLEAADLDDYKQLIANNNVAQQSWNFDFGDVKGNNAFDATVEETYAVSLKAFKDGVEVAAVDITIFATTP